MTEFLKHQSSIAYYDNNRSGCMWGLFHLLDFHRHTNSRKLLAYRRHNDGELGRETKVATSRRKILKQSMDKEVIYKMENQGSKKSSGMLSSLYKRITKKPERKKKNSPSAPRMLRTISIHHLECNDYVDETTSDSEHSGAKLNSQESVSFISSSGSYMFSETKEPESSTALQELGNADKESTSRVFQDRRSVSVNQLQTRHASTEELELNKSASFPGAGLTGSAGGISKDKRKNKVSSQIQGLKSSKNKTVEDTRLQALESMANNTATVNSTEVDDRNVSTASVHWKDFSRSVKDAIIEDKKDRLRISMDGILHKVPSGHNLPEYIEKEKLKLGSSAKFENRSMQRSRSLVESLDRYSPLLESISDREPKRVPERLRSLKEEDDNRRVLRSRSLTESAYRNSHLIKSSSVREPKRVFERVVSVRENQGLPDRKSMINFGRLLSNPEILSYSFSKDIQSYESHEPASGLLVTNDVDTYVSDGPELVDTLVDTKDGMDTDTAAQETGGPKDTETVDCLQLPEISEQELNEACIVSENSMAMDNYSAALHKESEVDTERDDTVTDPIPDSVIDTHLEEDVVDPEHYEIIQDAELPPSWIQFEEHDSGSYPEDYLGDCDATEEAVEIIKEEQRPNLNSTCSLHIAVDQKDEDEFNYVSHIVSKSGLSTGGAGELLWSSPLEQLLFMDVEGNEDGTFDMPLDRQLMLDVMNEVLVGIYDSSIARSTKFRTSSDPRIRPVPTGNHVLEEVWAKISWYISSEQYSSNPLDNVVARDFARSDGWMDLHWDMESVGLEVEDLILDELIEEILLE